MPPKRFSKNHKASGGVAALPAAYMGTRWRFTDRNTGMEYVGFFVNMLETIAGVKFCLGFADHTELMVPQDRCTPTNDPISPHSP